MKCNFVQLRTQGSALLFAAILTLQATHAAAQVFNAASLPEYPYPVPGTVIPGPLPNPVNITTHSFSYTFSHISYMTPAGFQPAPMCPPGSPPCPAPGPPMNNWLSDLTIHTWDDPGSTAGLAWINRATGSGIPGTIYDQGFMMYPQGVQNIEASLQEDSTGFAMPIFGTTAAWYVVVSFYNGNPLNYAGVGHYLEVYRWERPIPISTGGLTFINRVRLSAIPNYTRISQDGHNGYGVAVTWADPNPASPTFGIDFVMGFMNAALPGVSLSPVTTLTGTGGQTNPDVAFSHTGNGLKLQFVYNGVAGGVSTITESEIAFVLGPPWGPLFVAPLVNDVNFVGPFGLANFKTRIDCPDHYGQDNWAYSYLLPGIPPFDIFVRFMNWNAPNFGVPATYNLTNGSLGPTLIKQNDWPVLSFDANVSPSRVNVGWYTQDQNNPFWLPNAGGYVDAQLDETGVITNPLDYMQVALLTTASNKDASATPSIAYSRQNDRTDYHYPVFANQLCPSNAAQMQTKERPWTVAAFKGNAGGGASEIIDQIYSGKKPVSVTDAKQADIIAYPNPFANDISVVLPASLADKELNVAIEDITGRVVDKFTAYGRDVNEHLHHIGATLANGSYLLHFTAEGLNKAIKVEKLERK